MSEERRHDQQPHAPLIPIYQPMDRLREELARFRKENALLRLELQQALTKHTIDTIE